MTHCSENTKGHVISQISTADASRAVRPRPLFFVLAPVFLVCCAWGQSYSFRIVNVPGAALSGLNGISNSGQIVGLYAPAPACCEATGFLLSKGSFKVIAYPKAIDTEPEAVNKHSLLVGVYKDSGDLRHSFEFQGSKYKNIDYPGAAQSSADDINDNGSIVGSYYDGAHWHGYTLESGKYASVDYPGAANTIPARLNNAGEIVGWYYQDDNITHGFSYSAGTFTPIDFPGSASTGAFGLNNNGEIAGAYVDASGNSHGFTFSSGVYVTVDYPGASDTAIYGLNDAGQAVGFAQTDFSTTIQGFMASPPGGGAKGGPMGMAKTRLANSR